jgi:hypothetical protein
MKENTDYKTSSRADYPIFREHEIVGVTLVRLTKPSDSLKTKSQMMKLTKRYPTRNPFQLSNSTESIVINRHSGFMSSVDELVQERSIASSSTQTVNLSDEPSYDESPPSYNEYKRSARCEEDLSNPPPSYSNKVALCRPSGVDQLAAWLVSRTSWTLRKKEE